MALPLSNRAVIVSGAAQGFGKAIASRFLRAGATVIGCDINEAKVTETATELNSIAPTQVKGAGTFHGIRSDVSSEKDVAALFEQAASLSGPRGRVDVLVNNAALVDHFMPTMDTTQDLWDQVIRVNLTGPFVMSKFAIRHFLENPPPAEEDVDGTGRRKGAIVNVSSVAGIMGLCAGAAYTASKHGLLGLTKNIAAFYGPAGIRCNAILPGVMPTPMAASLADDTKDSAVFNSEVYGILSKAIEASRVEVLDLEDVANVVVGLASNETSFALNGVSIPVDRGWASYR